MSRAPSVPDPASAPKPEPQPLSDRADLLSAMTSRYSWPFRWFAHRFFGHVEIDPEAVARLRELEASGSIVYVMRYASRLDYFLFNTLFLREGLRLSEFANGVHFYYYRPLFQALRIALGRLRRGRRLLASGVHAEQLGTVSSLVGSGRSLFLFLRTRRLRSRLLGRRRAVRQGREELDYIEETVRATWGADRPVYVVPLALFWRKGPRQERRFLNLGYGARSRPSDLAKVTSFLTDYRGLYVKTGEPIELHAFIEKRRQEGVAKLARMVRRSIMLFLYREEKVVVGPPVRSLQRVQDFVLSTPEIQRAVAARAQEKGSSIERAQAEAEKILGEIAARMNSTFLAVLNFAVTAIFRRMFGGAQVTGLEKVTEYARHHPIVLMPNHRSYFDFLVLSWLFYNRRLVPPHIGARENMAFGPFGFIFRRAGAFFLRRSFDDPFYKAIFRGYLGYLVSEGFTQEFFIEGGRSRTGKMLAPRFGMVAWNVEAFLQSSRRDLFFVPIAITYERLVEEGAMIDEQEGRAKTEESMLNLVRARKFLKRRFGRIFVNFGEPISLAQMLGPRRAEAADFAESERAEALVREVVTDLGFRMVERINWATVANATSVAACALLGEGRRGLFRHELCERMEQVVELLRLQDVKMTAALKRPGFDEAIEFLLRSDLVKREEDPREEILYYEESHRRALDLYRNAIVHFLVAPSFLARRLRGGATRAELARDLDSWLTLFYGEYFVPKGEVLAAHMDAFLDYFERSGRIERRGDRYEPTEKGGGYLRFLAEQTRGMLEAYHAAFAAAATLEEAPVGRKALAQTAHDRFERGQLLGELSRPEASNPVTFGNAFELLRERGILARAEPDPRERRREPGYVRGERFEDLAALRHLLATALGAR
jgi:glycerol-3-phosphate O-acyltransferase